jgi:hypothetical protein
MPRLRALPRVMIGVLLMKLLEREELRLVDESASGVRLRARERLRLALVVRWVRKRDRPRGCGRKEMGGMGGEGGLSGGESGVGAGDGCARSGEVGGGG